ncbi:DMT family transporter [Cellulosilyticum sp. I15G10I2]|uniref:DMT family transporter n=1 Tax=Cellulosilyticum sp. I15G10I2 TaxID=1892843 RepID=UPI00085BD118|nr:DMT family transporter [Cellulosilyticum sp. I15G10I2]
MENKKMIYHMMALVTICIWGTTFVSTKILLNTFSPLEIMFYRFIITYITLIVIHPKMYAFSLKEESGFALLGIFGGSMYFLTENIAINLTLASHVGFILAAAPIFTALVAHFLTKDEKIIKTTWIGCIVAMAGVFLVIFNGSFILKFSGLGEVLATVSALSWAVYTVLLKKLDPKYPPIYTIRKVFFYAIITIVPILIGSKYKFEITKFMDLGIVFHLLFLGLAASALGFILWHIAVKNLGAVKTNNYIYLNPVITLIGSAWVLKEKITIYAGIGSALILLGVYLTQKKPNQSLALSGIEEKL